MAVFGTAGHVDHGKSALVRALTGTDPDRLEEEKTRGMTIDLGFASLPLPTGDSVSLVDVPGHERFVKNMVAGAGGIDGVLLVVAADEGVMPQTREHVDIVDLLGIEKALVVVSKADLVDEEWLHVVRDDIEQELGGSSLAGAPSVAVSALTRAGLSEVVEWVDRSVANAPAIRTEAVPFLAVDRVFSARGFGTVVTGTLQGGPLSQGDAVEIVPAQTRARIRGIQSHGRSMERVGPGTRVAINLGGIDRSQIGRGDVVAPPDCLRPTRSLDAEIRLARHGRANLLHGMSVTLHVGSAERQARVLLYDRAALEPGEVAIARLRLDSPVAAVRNQHFVLRLPSPVGTIAGGRLLDVYPPPRRRGERERLERLAGIDMPWVLSGLLDARRPVTLVDAARRLGVSESSVRGVVATREASGSVQLLGDSLVSDRAWTHLRGSAVAAVSRFHKERPEREGMPVEELRSRLLLLPAQMREAVERMEEEGVLVRSNGFVALPDFRGGAQWRRADVERVTEVLEAAENYALSREDVAARANVTMEFVKVLEGRGDIIPLPGGLCMCSARYDAVSEDVLEAIRSHGSLTVADVRDRLRSSRKFTLALLESLDDSRRTRRVGDHRELGPSA